MEHLPKLKNKREREEKSWYVGTFYPLNIHSFLPSWNTHMNSRILTSIQTNLVIEVYCQEAFNKRLPVCYFASVRSPLALINS